MSEHGHDDVEVPQPINLFMNIPVLPGGSIGWEAAETQAGDSVTLEAEMDVIIVLSACPQDLIGINRGEPGPLEIELL
jgi:uncharacterized protein YcgI (DUF1989 family)